MIQFHPNLIMMDSFSAIPFSSNGPRLVHMQDPQSAVHTLEIGYKPLYLFWANIWASFIGPSSLQ